MRHIEYARRPNEVVRPCHLPGHDADGIPMDDSQNRLFYRPRALMALPARRQRNSARVYYWDARLGHVAGRTNPCSHPEFSPPVNWIRISKILHKSAFPSLSSDEPYPQCLDALVHPSANHLASRLSFGH